MRETLFIRLASPALDAPTAYCIADAATRHSWPVAEAPLSEVLARAAGRRVVVLVPAQDVRLTSVKVPAKGAAKVLQAAPYALEDQLAEDVETLHFAIGPRQLDGSHPVAAVSKARMNAWLLPLREAGITPEAVIPETLCLPALAADSWSALAEPDHISVRTGAYAGFGCAPEDLSLFLGLADPNKAQRLRIAIPRAHAPDFTGLEWPVDLLPGFGSALEILLHHYVPAQAINLLQGAYAVGEGAARLLKPWRSVAALLLALVVITLAHHGVQAWRLGKELTAQNRSNAERFTQIFPSETRVVDLAAQLDQQTRGSGGGARGSLLPLTEALSRALANTPTLNVKSLQFREGALFVSLSGTELQQLDVLRGVFEQNREAKLEVQDANSGAEGVQIRLKISPP